MDSVNDYVDLVKAPWGKMFYDLLFAQLDIPHLPRLKILDLGSGLGVTANHFAAWHDITAIEPNEEMINNRLKENKYEQIQGGVEKIAIHKDVFFDIVFCHNVLEYIEDKEPIVAELLRVLKSDGILSIVKHNRVGRVFKQQFMQMTQKLSHYLMITPMIRILIWERSIFTRMTLLWR